MTVRWTIDQAEKALEQAEVPVGAVFVHETLGILGRGFNQTNVSLNGTRHAEMVAMDAILDKFCPVSDSDSSSRASRASDLFSKTDLFVSVEPCVMCAAALRWMGLRAVYYGCANDRFGGNGSVFSVHSECVSYCPIILPLQYI